MPREGILVCIANVYLTLLKTATVFQQSWSILYLYVQISCSFLKLSLCVLFSYKKNSVYIRNSILCQIYVLQVFSPIPWPEFYVLNVISGWTEVFNFNEIELFIFFLLCYVLHVLFLRNSCLFKVTKFSPMFSFKIFILLAFIIMSMISFELILCMKKNKGWCFLFSYEDQLLQYHLLKINWTYICETISRLNSLLFIFCLYWPVWLPFHKYHSINHPNFSKS